MGIRDLDIAQVIPFPVDATSIMQLRNSSSMITNVAAKAGDWICPNPACKDIVFARNAVCRKCQTPRPTRGSLKQGSQPDWHCPTCLMLINACHSVCSQCGGSKPNVEEMPRAVAAMVSAKPGDWTCPQCHDL